MVINVQETRALAGRRVRVVTEWGDYVGVLRGVPSADVVKLQDTGLGIMTITDPNLVSWEPFTCSRCGDRVDKLSASEPTWCVECVRERASREREQPTSTACEDCGKPGAFRNPMRDNTHLRCAQCHAARGSLPEDYSVLVLAAGERARCATEDIDSPLHAWHRMKTSRWRCTGNLCNAERYTPPED